MNCSVVLMLTSLCAGQVDLSGKDDDYNQWKQALGVTAATAPAAITRPPGFVVELLRTSQGDEGSWISCIFDPQGHLLVSREKTGVLRMKLVPIADDDQDLRSAKQGKGSPRDGEGVASVEVVENTLLECRGLLWAYDALYANANNSKGLYRLRDTNGDGTFDEVTLLRKTPGNVGHGRNDLALGPDGRIYSIHGDDVLLPEDDTPTASPVAHWHDARLFPCEWDRNLFNSYMRPPGGHLIRTDREGKTWEVVASGMRNPYGIDFSPEGEAFTFDADMEWDVGVPWYRPTRVLHLVSGSDWGWRVGTGPWPAWYPDSLPAAVDVGLGSPTAVKFGTRTKYPEAWRRALFIADWAYGRILAVQLKPQGAGYVATEQPFLAGRPLNVTDLEVGPDGHLYFITGGRGTVSGLYRVRYTGAGPNSENGEKKSTASADSSVADDATRVADTEVADKASVAARQLRKRLEAYHGRQDSRAMEQAWPHLDSSDLWVRHAARIAVESQPW
ncbi:MAG: hypothetical protein RIS70_1748, partial [Planctomycetota bacterium]